jgi:hypothetical protein
MLDISISSVLFKRAIRAFEDSAGDADVAVIFYAGHGIEIAGTNYLIPVDAKLASDRDASDEAIDLNRLISTVDGVKRLRLIILDACRDNPFLSRMKRRQVQRQITSGLGPVNVGSDPRWRAHCLAWLSLNTRRSRLGDGGSGKNRRTSGCVLAACCLVSISAPAPSPRRPPCLIVAAVVLPTVLPSKVPERWWD